MSLLHFITLIAKKIRNRQKIIKAFIITFNEESTISLTINHYKKICSEIYIFDNYSTDNTKAICLALGCKVTLFGEEGVLDDRAYLEVKNNAWKNHRDADYVIVCDADELLYNIPSKLNKDIYVCRGYNMYSETVPKSWDEVQNGYPQGDYDKTILFNPKKIKEIYYTFGAHKIDPKIYNDFFSVKVDNSSTLLKHMRYIGGVKRMIDRYNLYSSRMSNFNRENELGFQYLMDVEEIKNNWEEAKQKSLLVEDQ